MASFSDADQSRQLTDDISNLSSTPKNHDEFVAPPLKRKRTAYGTTWEKLNMLSFDGGGIRGYWSLLVLQKLMHHIGEIEEELAAKASIADEVTKNKEIARREGLHSFWPEPYPTHVSLVQEEYRSEDDEDRKLYDETGAGNGTAEEIRKWQRSRRYLPCHYFDYICGTSTGSLIAIMLARFRMTVKDCLHEYRSLGDLIFGHPRKLYKAPKGRYIALAAGREKFDARNLEHIFQDFTYRRAEVRDPYTGPVTLPTQPGVCKALVATLKSNPTGTTAKTFFLRSYRHPEAKRRKNDFRNVNRGEAHNLEIWQVARAATAAPTVFESLKIRFHPQSTHANREEHVVFTDGGFKKVNNPCKVCYDEIRALHGSLNGDTEEDDLDPYNSAKIGVVVSIGTAKGARKFGTSVADTINNAVDEATDTESPHYAMLEAAQQDKGLSYYRFNSSAKKGLNIPLDDWRPSGFRAKHGLRPSAKGKKSGDITLKEMDEHFEIWYGSDVPAGNKHDESKDITNREFLQTCARALVEIRRERVLQEKARWERYASVAHYYCDNVNCEAEFPYKDLFKEHRTTHGENGKGKKPVRNETDDFASKCRKVWVYPPKYTPESPRFRV